MIRVAVVFEAERTGYSIEQMADGALTVGELREMLEFYDDDTIVVISHDSGYTYGSLYMLGEAVERDGEWEKYFESRW